MYLNDVEAGGGTRFTDLDMTVVPQVRREGAFSLYLAVMFSNVLVSRSCSGRSRSYLAVSL